LVARQQQLQLEIARQTTLLTERTANLNSLGASNVSVNLAAAAATGRFAQQRLTSAADAAFAAVRGEGFNRIRGGLGFNSSEMLFYAWLQSVPSGMGGAGGSVFVGLDRAVPDVRLRP
jgi:hypothetical protein